MSESRRQQAQRGAYTLGKVYPRLCEIDLVSAAQIFTDITDTHLRAPSRGSDPSQDWPLTAGEAHGWLQHGQRLSTLGAHAAARDMARALRDALASRGADGTEPGPALALLTANMHHADAWAAVLEPGDNPVDLARAGSCQPWHPARCSPTLTPTRTRVGFSRPSPAHPVQISPVPLSPP